MSQTERMTLATVGLLLATNLMLLAARTTERGIARRFGLVTASSRNVELVGKLRVHDAGPGVVSDVATLGRHAYLGRFAPGCRGGVYVIDISRPDGPREVGFVRSAQGTYVGEGVQALRLATRAFRGDVLVHSVESCRIGTGGGAALWDVTDPRHPHPLSAGFGDAGSDGLANEAHSAFAWQQGERAFVVLADVDEFADVDIFEITDPRTPVMVTETGIQDWPDARRRLGRGATTYLHDMVVRRLAGGWRMLLSYWDAGWVVLDVDDPARPRYIADFEYPDPDPLTGGSPPEGNAHTAEWSRDGRYVLGTDEDFSPFRPRTPTLAAGPERARDLERPAGLPGRTAPGIFDGWGYLRLLDARSLRQLDGYAVAEARDEEFASGLQGLSVHEVATDPGADLAYLSYHHAGFRVVSFAGGRLKEVGHYVDEGGSNLWGVEVARGGGRLVLASDRDVGLYLFRYTGGHR